MSSKYPWLNERTILLSLTGSQAYGTNIDDSDHDYRGVCIPPMEYYLGLEYFNEYKNSGGKNFKDKKDSKDVVIHHVNKFVKDAMDGTPNNIEILFTRPEDYVKITELGQLLIDNRHLFLSKKVKNRFGGYARSQAQKLINKNSNGTGRRDLIEKYGYDTKFFMHSVRLLTSAIEILDTGDYSTYRTNRDFLLECRNGKYTLEEALWMIEDYDVRLNESFNRSELPEEPDFEAVNNLLIKINREGLNLTDTKEEE